MRTIRALLAGCVVLVAGCGQPPKELTGEEKIAANLAVLGDGKELAENQRFCAIKTQNRLGSMGVPVKIEHKDQTIYLCCEACLPAAKKDLDAAIQTADRLIRETCLAQLPAEDQPLAKAQRFCASDGVSPLGSMGMPVKIMVKGQPVFLCCAGCEKSVREDEDKALALVKKLRESK